MGTRVPTAASITVNTPFSAAGTETVVAITPPINLSVDNALVFLHWYFDLSVGALATNVTIRLRRGSTVAGVQINQTAALTVVANNQAGYSGCYVDTPGVGGGLVYCLTALITGGAANGNNNDVSLLAFVL